MSLKRESPRMLKQTLTFVGCRFHACRVLPHERMRRAGGQGHRYGAAMLARENKTTVSVSQGERADSALSVQRRADEALRRSAVLAGRRAGAARFAARSQAPSRPDVRHGRRRRRFLGARSARSSASRSSKSLDDVKATVDRRRRPGRIRRDNSIGSVRRRTSRCWSKTATIECCSTIARPRRHAGRVAIRLCRRRRAKTPSC